MLKKKKCVAMLLAGGQGSRLYALTRDVAKPAVRFGSKYRIIDFPLSNCINSGIDTVGVLTQYQPLVLSDYIGNGGPWDLDRMDGGVHILPPYQGLNGADWYKGTANAIYQNLRFIQNYDPDYVLILSGDHIYKMDYAKMLDRHIETGADVTISVINVPMEEASRFGIMNTNPDGTIYEFEEKPKNPKSTKASMGIYIFSKKVLFDFLIADEANPNSSNDFGKDVIPALLAAGKRLVAYEFEGYWKDVGTISSLWEANLDLLGTVPNFNLNDPSWKIYYRHDPLTPQYISDTAKISNALIAEGCEIYGTVENSVLFDGITVEEGAVIRDSVVFTGCVVKKGASIDYSIVDEKSVIGEGARIGAPRDTASVITVIPSKTCVADGDTVNDSNGGAK